MLHWFYTDLKVKVLFQKVPKKFPPKKDFYFQVCIKPVLGLIVLTFRTGLKVKRDTVLYYSVTCGLLAKIVFTGGDLGVPFSCIRR